MMKASAVILVLVLITGSQAFDSSEWIDKFVKHVSEGGSAIGRTVESFYGSRLIQNLTEKQKETREGLLTLIDNSHDTVKSLGETVHINLSELTEVVVEDVAQLGDALDRLAEDIIDIVDENIDSDEVESWLLGLVTKPRHELDKHLEQLSTLVDAYNKTYVQVAEKVNHTVSQLKPRAMVRWLEIRKKARPLGREIVLKTIERLHELRKFLTPQVHELDSATGSHLKKLYTLALSMIDSLEDID